MSEGYTGNDHGEVASGGPAIWPLAAALAALVAGAALVWWSGDTRDDVRGVAAGAAVAVLGALAAIWAWASRVPAGRAPGTIRDGRALVVAFAIPQGILGAARAEAGILAALDRLVETSGAREARLTATPAASGPMEVLVEITREQAGRGLDDDREALAALLDAHSAEILPGSVRVFSMDVVRNTRTPAFQFTGVAAAGLLVAIGAGAFALGGLLSLFQSEPAGPVGPDGVPTPEPETFVGVIVEKRIRFRITEFRLPPNTEVTLTEDNQDPGIPHNIRFFNGPATEGATLEGCNAGCDGTGVVTPVRFGITTNDFTFTTPGPGRYAFHCDVHPATMKGIMVIEEGAPLPGQ